MTQSSLVGEWTGRAEADLTAMLEEQAELQSSGRWRSGPRTLLQAAGVHGLEVPLTSAVAWLLRPDGHHAIGDKLLRKLLEHAGMTGDPGWPVTVVVEETREDTRADLVIRSQQGTVLVEAKIGAPEQDSQCQRLETLWSAESPVLVFLTRDGRAPTTARLPWVTLTWSELGTMLRSCLPEIATGGELDLLRTLDAFYR